MVSPERAEGLTTLEQETKKKSKTMYSVLNLGMVEMTRKKTRQNINDFLQRSCPYCGGTGRVLSEETLAQCGRKLSSGGSVWRL